MKEIDTFILYLLTKQQMKYSERRNKLIKVAMAVKIAAENAKKKVGM